MGRLFAILALIIAIAVVGVLMAAATRPKSFRVVRSAFIPAPPERVYPLVADFHRWTEWSPWEKLDPAMSRTYEGAAMGPGAVYGWSGSGKAGAGRMEIVDALAPSRVRIDLHFLKPFDSRSETVFTLAPERGGTQVTWDMHGPSPFISRLMGLVFNMDKMIGKDFEAGLANLGAAVQGEAPRAKA